MPLAYEVVWAGRGPLPGIGNIERTGHYLSDCAPSRSTIDPDLAQPYTKKRRAPTVRCACGRLIPVGNQRNGCVRCPSCRQAKRGGKHRR